MSKDRSMPRKDFQLISDLVPNGSSVLDLGCGDGTLLAQIRDGGAGRVCGVELNLKNMSKCVELDLPIIRSDLDHGLECFPDDCFDIIVLSHTLQMVKRPALVLREMLRVARRGIVSVPNFGHWKVRQFLALRGRLPLSPSLPYAWYETPSIHHLTIKDFRDFIAASGGVVEQELPLRSDGANARVLRFLPDLRATSLIAVIARREGL